MTSPTVVMTQEHARNMLGKIKQGIQSLDADLKSFNEFRGWEILGYDDLQSCLRAECGYSNSYLSRLTTQLAITDEIQQLHPDAKPKERHTRTLNKLSSVTSRQQAYTAAKQMAETEGRAVEQKHIDAAVEQESLKETILKSPHKLIARLMSGGDLTPHQAEKLISKLEQLDEKTYLQMNEIIATHKMISAELILPFAEMLSRGSITAQNTLKYGTINGKLICDASLEDLEAEKRESRAMYIADSLEKKRKQAESEGRRPVIAHIITVYENDPVKTLRELKKVLPYRDLIVLERVLGE